MEVDFDLFKPLGWTKSFKCSRGTCVVYVLFYEGKKYVGKTFDLQLRLYTWRGKLIEDDIWSGKIVELHVIPSSEGDNFEEALIAKLGTVRPDGHNKNSTGKGSHVPGWHHTAESKAKTSASIRKYIEEKARVEGKPVKEKKVAKPKSYKRSLKVRKKISVGNKIFWSDPDNHARMVEVIRKAKAGKPVSAETRAKISAARKAYLADPANEDELKRLNKTGKLHKVSSRAKTKKSMKAFWADPGNREKMMSARRDQAAKVSKAQKAIWANPEYRAKMSAIRAETKLRKLADQERLRELEANEQERLRELEARGFNETDKCIQMLLDF